MEKINKSKNTNGSIDNPPLENDFYCSSFLQMSKTLKTIRELFPNEENKNLFFSIKLLIFKKISKNLTTIEIFINDKKFILNYDYLSKTIENAKREKKELTGNIVEEIIENFQPLTSLNLYSDSLNRSGNYTSKHLVNDCSLVNNTTKSDFNIKKIELNNYLFYLNLANINNEYPIQNENNITYFKKIYEKLKIEDLHLNFQFNRENSGENFIQNFKFILQQSLNSYFLSQKSLPLA